MAGTETMTAPRPRLPLKWHRDSGSNCIVPTALSHKLFGGDGGCFCLAFSREGTRLAAVCLNNGEFSINVFTVMPKVLSKKPEGLNSHC